MTPEERRHIENGVWMCRKHARLIDADYTEYSAATIKDWKIQAEYAAYMALKLKSPELHGDALTLIQIGPDIIFFGKWISAEGGIWTLQVSRYVYGEDHTLIDYCSCFESAGALVRFVVIENQGDSRWITRAPAWRKEDEKLIIELNVGPKHPRTDPHNSGSSLALSQTGDLVVSNGDLMIVSGVENAKQGLATVLGVQFGDLIFHPEQGSHFGRYFRDHQENLSLLSSLLRLEISRLAGLHDEDLNLTALEFINRVLSVKIKSKELVHHRVVATVEIEWGNNEVTADDYFIFADHENIRQSLISF
jgi:hypothetical protein